MEIRKLTLLSELESIYNTCMIRDFPPNERRPLASLAAGWNRDEYDCYGLYEGNELLAYAFFVRLPGKSGFNYLFDYLAVCEGHRGEGIGSAFLRLLSGRIQNAECIVGEMEDPDAPCEGQERAIREKRRRFYMRAGFLDTDVRACVFGVDYLLFEVPTKRAHTKDEIREIYTSLYRSILLPPFFETQFHLK